MNPVLRQIIKGMANRLGIEVRRRQVPAAAPAATELDDKFDVFADSAGNRHDLIRGHRARTWPHNWSEMLQKRAVPSPEAVRQNGFLSGGVSQVESLQECLRPWGIGLNRQRILEVGCFVGGASAALLLAGAESVVGLDVAAHQTLKSRPSDEEIAAQADYLQAMRRLVSAEAAERSPTFDAARLEYWDIDIKDVRVRGDFDLIASWYTLEHILEPQPSFARMFDALRPGGYCAQIYHPFFCLSGAHFDCLDFPWGHVVLSDDDFRAYVRRFRPDEVQIAEWRYCETINRMTFALMKDAARMAGFELVDFAPLESRGHDSLPDNILAMGRRIHPTLTSMDLLVEGAFVLLRKP